MDRSEFISRLFERIREREAAEPAVRSAGSETCYEAGSSFHVNVKQGEIVGYNVSDSIGLGFRMRTGSGRMGYASTQILDEAAIDQLVDGALENAALVESEDEQFLFDGANATYPALALFNPALEALSAAEKIDMAKRLEQLTLAQDGRITQVEECGIMSISRLRALTNGSGLDVESRANLLLGYVVAVAREDARVNTGFKLFTATDPSEIDLEKTAREAAREAVDGLNGAPVPSGRYRVLLRNDMAATLLSTFSDVFSADNAQRGLSRLKGREGEVIAAPCVTLVDDPHRAGSAASSPFDGEGVPTRVKRVVEEGRLTTLLHNLRTAYKQGVETTANAARASYASTVSIAPSNFYVQPGEADFDAMLGLTGDGLLITGLEGMHAGADSVTGDFSLAARGFRVENGRLGAAVNQITVAGNFYELLGDVEAVGSDLKFLNPDVSCFGSPCVLVRGLSVAGC